MGSVKRYLEDLSDEIGYGGSINAEVIAEATRRLTSLPPTATGFGTKVNCRNTEEEGKSLTQENN